MIISQYLQLSYKQIQHQNKLRIFNLIKYEKGDHYPNHYDGNTSLGRHLSAILYINDNFKGGEFSFFNNRKPRLHNSNSISQTALQTKV